jgi:L-alanine-DL-glutamate epimerase-like enolase superfamily enzyme
VSIALMVKGAPLRAPFAAAHGAVQHRELLGLELHDPASGLRGFGEAAPLESYDGVSMRAVIEALRDCLDVLKPFRASMAIDPGERAALLAECERRAVLPQAIAAIDLALWDIAGRAARKPVWQLLDPHAMPPTPVDVNYTIAAPDRAGAATEAARARTLGFGTVKLKVGTGDDAGRVAAVRAAAGPDMAIRLDANGAWSVAEAIRWLEVLAPAGIELCEEPVHGVEQIAEVARSSPVPVAIDESTSDPATFGDRHAHAVCLKISRGGITGVLAQARRARELGYAVYLSSTLDGPLGIAAALHAARIVEPDLACGLATLPLFADHPDPLPAHSGVIAPPLAPGLGPEALVAWYDAPLAS